MPISNMKNLLGVVGWLSVYLWLGTLPLYAQPQAEASAEKGGGDGGPPMRPVLRVLDETGALTVTEREALTRDFTAAAESGLSLYLLILNAADGLAEDDPATELARVWEDAPLTAVFLQVPGQPLRLGFSGSRLPSLQQAEIAGLMDAALAAGRAQQSMPEQGKAAARQLISDFTRYRAGLRIEESVGPGVLAGQPDPTHQLMVWGGGASIIFLLGLLILMRRGRASRPKLFPLAVPRSRFSAPHSGGNDVMISFLNDREKGG